MKTLSRVLNSDVIQKVFWFFGVWEGGGRGKKGRDDSMLSI